MAAIDKCMECSLIYAPDMSHKYGKSSLLRARSEQRIVTTNM